MFDVIDFLESVGQDAGQCHADRETLAEALREAAIAPEMRAALLAGDGLGLATMLGKSPYCCYINPAKEEEDEESEEKPDQKDKPRQTPTRKPD